MLFSMIWKLAVVLIAFTALSKQIGIFNGKFKSWVLIFYTTLSNILVMLFMLLSFISEVFFNQEHVLFQFTHTPEVRFAVMMCITLTGLIYHFLLSTLDRKRGKEDNKNYFWTFDNLSVHYAVPIMTVLDYYFFKGEATPSYFVTIGWTVIPLVYIAFVYIRAHFGGNIGDWDTAYPYFFFDIKKNGLKKTILYIVAIYIAFILIGNVMYGIGMLL